MAFDTDDGEKIEQKSKEESAKPKKIVPVIEALFEAAEAVSLCADAVIHQATPAQRTPLIAAIGVANDCRDLCRTAAAILLRPGDRPIQDALLAACATACDQGAQACGDFRTALGNIVRGQNMTAGEATCTNAANACRALIPGGSSSGGTQLSGSATAPAATAPSATTQAAPTQTHSV
jgi:hypothetical protein